MNGVEELGMYLADKWLTIRTDKSELDDPHYAPGQIANVFALPNQTCVALIKSRDVLLLLDVIGMIDRDFLYETEKKAQAEADDLNGLSD